ncbi:MAG: phosphopentomutase [Clostridiales bacterium]|jgi:phosphopentomutase|nr:phosphopentomutase [Clostridiales bacterium]
MKRVILIILDSLGIGAMPDAYEFDLADIEANTLGNIYKAMGGLEIPNLYKMGIGNIDGSMLPNYTNPIALHGKIAEKVKGKDTISGHWEIAGKTLDKPFATYPGGFPQECMEKFEKAIGRKSLANVAASGTEIIKRLGDEHLKTGYPIVYTSADSVFQIAAHEEVITVDELYKICEKARHLLCGEYGIARVIARPFLGEAGSYYRSENRRDFVIMPPRGTMLDLIKDAGLNVHAIGKIEDIFGGQGITSKNHSTNNKAGIEATLEAMAAIGNGLIFTNLVDFDMLYGHRNDVKGYARALEYFDLRLSEIMAAMRPDDILILTADHGCDPTTPSTDHSREYIPCLIYGQSITPKNFGLRNTFADIGATACDYLGVLGYELGSSIL